MTIRTKILMETVSLYTVKVFIVVEHFGWPDHYPPPFEFIQPILTSIHAHLSSDEKAIAVLHCKGINFCQDG